MCRLSRHTSTGTVLLAQCTTCNQSSPSWSQPATPASLAGSSDFRLKFWVHKQSTRRPFEEAWGGFHSQSRVSQSTRAKVKTKQVLSGSLTASLPYSVYLYLVINSMINTCTGYCLLVPCTKMDTGYIHHSL
jgi:hypothetical protein